MSFFENLFRKFKRYVDRQEHKEHVKSRSVPDKIPATDDEKTRKLETIRLYGVDFPIASNVEELCKMAADQGRCAMLIDINNYAQMWHATFRYFNDKFGLSSRFVYGVTSAQLICLGCKLVFPFSYKVSLKGGFEGFGDVVGATEGYKEFGQTARCPKCSSGQACFAIDNLPAEEITQRDIDYIREYWHHLAQQWWKTESRTQALCDACGSPVLRDDGYLRINDLMCKQCCESHLGADSLEKLRENPSYFGEWELRKARYFTTNLGVPHSSGTDQKSAKYDAQTTTTNKGDKERLTKDAMALDLGFWWGILQAGVETGNVLTVSRDDLQVIMRRVKDLEDGLGLRYDIDPTRGIEVIKEEVKRSCTPRCRSLFLLGLSLSDLGNPQRPLRDPEEIGILQGVFRPLGISGSLLTPLSEAFSHSPPPSEYFNSAVAKVREELMRVLNAT